MAGRSHRKQAHLTKFPVNARRRSRPRLRPIFDMLEIRRNLGSAYPANVTEIYDSTAQSLSVSFTQAVGSTDTPVYGAVFLYPVDVTSDGGLLLTGMVTSASKTVTFPSGTTTIGLLANQTVSGTGIPSGTTISSVNSSSQITLSNAATATSPTGGTSLDFDMVLTGTLQGGITLTGANTTSGSTSVTGLSTVLPGATTSGSPTVTGMQTALTGSTTNGSPTVTFSGPGNTTTGLSVGEPVSGTGIPTGTTIKTINSNTSLTLSQNATQNSPGGPGGGTSLTFGGTANLSVGEGVSGTGIPSGTTIAAINSASSITLSKNATTNSGAGGTSLTFNLASGLSVGEYVVANGIPTGDAIASIGPTPGTITLTTAATATGSGVSMTFGSPVVTGLSSTAGLFVGQSVMGTGIPIPTLPNNPTQGTPENKVVITSIGSDGHSITLSQLPTASGPESLDFITGMALDGSGQEFVDNTINYTTVYTQTYTYSSTFQDPYLLNFNQYNLQACVNLYHNTGVASGFHSVIGDGPGLNTDNSFTNNGNSPDYQVYSGLIDITHSGNAGANDNTTTATATGTLQSIGATGTLHGLSSTGTLHSLSSTGTLYTGTLTGTLHTASLTGTLYNTSLTGTLYNTSLTGTLHTSAMNGAFTPNSKSVTGLSSTANLLVGQSVTGNGIAAGTTIGQINSSTAITLSTNTTGGSGPGGNSLTFGSPVVTGLSSTANLLVGESVTGTGIPSGTTISAINSSSQITLSQNATAGGSSSLTFSSPVVTGLSSTAGLLVGESVTGTGIPAGTTVSAINSSTQITLSNNATTSGSSSLTFSSPVVTGLSSTANLLVGESVTGTGIPAGTTISAINSSSQITLSANATAGGSSTLSFSSPVVTGLSSTANLLVGESVTGTGIPAGTTISAINSSTQITLSQSATTNGSSTLSFTSPVVTGLSSTANLLVGEPVTGTGIPAGTTISAINSSTQVTLSQSATTNGSSTLTFTSPVVTGLSSTANLFVGESVTGTGIPAGTTISAINSSTQITLSQSATTNGSSSLTFSSPVVTGLSSTTNLLVGETVTGTGIPAGTTIAAINSSTQITLSQGATAGGSTSLTIISPTVTGLTTVLTGNTTSGSPTVTGLSTTTNLVVGEPVSGTGIPSGTTITQINSTSLTITLSQNATATSSGGGTSLTFNLAGTLYVGEHVTGTGLPAGDTVASIGSTPGTITLTTAPTTTGSSTLTFDTQLVAGYRIIGGAVDLNFDGTINASDTTSTLAGHPQFGGFNVISGSIDLNGDGTINSSDSGDSGIDFCCPTPTIINPVADLAITKTDNDGGSSITGAVGSVVPGTSETYTIVVTNNGPSNVTGASVVDTLPANCTGDTWTATQSGGASGFSASGSGNISDTVTMPVGSSITYTVTGAVSPSARGTLTNTATVTAPAGVNDENLANNTATDTDTINPPSLSVTETGNGTVNSTDTASFTIVISNAAGAGTALGVVLSDPLPGGLTWTTDTGTINNGTLTDTIGNLAAGQSVIVHLNAPTPSGYNATLNDTATATPTNGAAASGSATDVVNAPSLSVTETGSGTVNSTDAISFTIVVSNATGAGTAYGVVLSDPLPGGLAWTTDAGTISGGTLTDTIGNLAAGQSVTFHLNAPTASGYSATLNNTATATPTNGSAASGSATDVVNAPSLSVNETGSGTVNSTDTVSFTIVVSNAVGAGTAYGVVLSDPLPGGLAWTTDAGAINGGTLTDTIGNLAAGQSVTIHLNAPTPAGYSATLNDTATATPTNGSAASGSATDGVDALSLSVNETGSGTVNSTDPVSFTITVSNATGAGTAYGVVLSDPLPGSLAWTTDAGKINGGILTDTIGNLAAGQSVTIHLNAVTPSGYSATLNNTATATPTNGSAASGSATDTVLAPSLSVTETGSGTVNSTDPVNFTIVVSNAAGAGTAYGVVVSDPLPGGLAWTTDAGTITNVTLTDTIGNLAAGQSVTIQLNAPTPSGYSATLNNTATATPTNGSAASGSATDVVNAPSLSVNETGSGTVNSTDTVSFTIVVSNATGAGTAYGVVLSDPLPGGLAWTTDAGTISSGTLTDTIGNLAAGSSVTIHLSAPTPSGYSATLNNTATATPTNGSAASGSATDVVNAPSLSVNETGSGTVNSTDPVSFTITVSNATGAGTAYGVVLSDPLPDSADLGWASTAGTIGNGTLTDAIGSLLAGQSVTITVSAPTPSGYSGTLPNTATATPTNGSAASGSATDTVLAPSLSVTETGNGTVNSTDPVSFTVTVSNTGPGTAYNVNLNDPLPDSGHLSWTITNSNDPNATISGGTLSDVIASLASGGSVTITVGASTAAGYSATLPNTATVTSSNNSPGSLTATATDTVLAPNVTVTKSGSGTVNSTDPVSFTVTVSNTGPGTAYNVNLNDPLPDSADLSWTITNSNDPNATISGGTLSDVIASLASGGSVTITVGASTAAGYSATLPNTATVTSSNNSPGGQTASATDTVQAPNLSITETGNSTTVTSPGTVFFTITVSNSGPGTAYNVNLNDPLPDATHLSWTIDSSTDSTAAISSGTLSDAIGSLAAGDSVVITVSASAPGGYSNTLPNTATASASNNSPGSVSDSWTDNVIAAGGLSISKTDATGGSSITGSTGTFTPGLPVTYTIIVTNNGSTADGVAVSDPMPAYLTDVTYTATATGGATAFTSSGSGNINDTVDMPSGSTITYTVTGTVNWCLDNGNLINTATATFTDPNTQVTTSLSATDTDLLPLPITVNSAADDPSGLSPGTVTLRDAINAVNLGTAESILFAIPGTPTITLAADLPAFTKLANIDGSTEPGVTVNGNGFVMLDDGSTVNIKDVSFTNGTVTVESNGTLKVASDFNVGDSTTVNNYGNLDVCCGSFLGGDSISVSDYNGAFFHVNGDFTLGDFGNVYQYGTAAMSVKGDFSMGVDGFVENGMDSAATATLTVGGSFSIAEDGVLYNFGTSTVSVTRDFSLGDFGFAYNGVNPIDAATLTVGGSLSIGESGFLYNSGDSKLSVTDNFMLGDGGFIYDGQDPNAAATFTVGGSFSIVGSGVLYTYGTSTASVAGNFTLGDGGAVFNGQDSTAAATLTVDGSLSIGDSGQLYNYGASTFRVTGDVTMGDGAFVDNGADPSDDAILTIGGSLSLGANTNLYDWGTSDLSVTGNFTMGDTSFFVDYGTMSVGGIFDPGTGDPFNPDMVSGTFNALPGSSVMTNTATWDVLAGGLLDVAAGATFNVTNGGTLDVEGSVTVEGTFVVYGSVTVEGLFQSFENSLVNVYQTSGGELITQGSGVIDAYPGTEVVH